MSEQFENELEIGNKTFKEEEIAFNKAKNLFQDQTRQSLINAKTIIDGGEFHIKKIREAMISADKRGDRKSFKKHSDEYNYEMGAAVARAKMDLQDGVSWAADKKWSKDEEVLRGAIDALREITHSPNTIGGDLMKKADNFWSDYIGGGKHLVDNLVNRKSPDNIDTDKLVQWAKDSGGDASKEKRNLISDSFEDYTKKHFPKNLDQYKEFESQFTPRRDATDIGRLGTEGGGGSKTAGTLGVIAGVGTLASNPWIGAALATLSYPMASPGNYLKAYGALRHAFRGKSEGELRGLLGTSYDRVMKAMEVGATKYQRLEDPVGAQDLYNQNFDFGEGSTIRPRAQ
jgi:hypothetical protein